MGFKRVASATTRHQALEIWKSPVSCEFRVAGAVHAWWHQERFLTGLAWDNLAAATLLRPEAPPRSVLMLGLAGGTTLRTLRHLLPDTRLTAIDLDPEIVDLAHEHMHLGETNTEIHIADAYDWVTHTDQCFDIVIDDCYLAGADDVYRPERHPEKLIGNLRPRIAPGGLLLANLVTGSGHRRLQSRMRAAFRRAFPQVRSVTTPDSLNETLVGGDHILTASSLQRWTSHFPSSKDQRYWDRIDVRLLS